MFVADLDSPELDEDDLHHLLRVLRLRDGETVGLSDGDGAWRLGRLSRGSAPGASVEAVGEVQHDPPPTPRLTIGLALPKGERAEWAVQKLTELGVDGIAVLETERSVVRWAGDRADKGLARLSRVARQAAAQSRRTRLPHLMGPLSVADFPVATTAVAEPGATVGPGLERPAVLVGPEGGWSESELPSEMVRVGLGPGVLRTETAAVAAAALLVGLRAGLITSRHSEW